MEREVQFLRQQIEYLDRMLETCLARISSLETQVAELQRRPVLRASVPFPAEALPPGAAKACDAETSRSRQRPRK